MNIAYVLICPRRACHFVIFVPPLSEAQAGWFVFLCFSSSKRVASTLLLTGGVTSVCCAFFIFFVPWTLNKSMKITPVFSSPWTAVSFLSVRVVCVLHDKRTTAHVPGKVVMCIHAYCCVLATIGAFVVRAFLRLPFSTAAFSSTVKYIIPGISIHIALTVMLLPI